VLGKRPEPELVPHFFGPLEDTHFEVRLTATQFLGGFRSPEIVEGLVRRLRDTDSDVRLAAVKGLGAIADPGAIEGLVLSLVDEERAIRQAAELSLDQIDPKWPQTEAAQRAGAGLEAALNDKPAWVRAAGLQVLTRLRTGTEGPALVQ
jgi:HEAT repeat protein